MKTTDFKRYILLFLEELEKNSLIDSVYRNPHFDDDPKFFSFEALLKSTLKVSDGENNSVEGYGCLFTSETEALFKALAEFIERLSQNIYKESSLLKSTFNQLKNQALDPYLYTKEVSDRDKNLHWVKGFRINNIPCLIPAQQIYLNYKKVLDKVVLSDLNSTGAAGGFSLESAVVRGIYEVIERDAFMTMFLTKIPPIRINLESINNKLIQKMISSCKKYNLCLELFEITNDIKIPTFMAMLIDRTSLGPCVGIGTKSSLSIMEAVTGCLQESFQTRTWLRKDMIELGSKRYSVNPQNINTFRERGLYWSSVKMLKHFDYLFKQSKKTIRTDLKDVPSNEFRFLKDIFDKKNMEVFYVNLSLRIFKKHRYYVCKTIIPALQPLILNEKHRVINHARLKSVSNYFGFNKYKINPLPQPFL